MLTKCIYHSGTNQFTLGPGNAQTANSWKHKTKQKSPPRCLKFFNLIQRFLIKENLQQFQLSQLEIVQSHSNNLNQGMFAGISFL